MWWYLLTFFSCDFFPIGKKMWLQHSSTEFDKKNTYDYLINIICMMMLYEERHKKLKYWINI